MKIKSIKINNPYFENTKLRYGDKTNIFFGQNCIGKTYIYNIIRSIVNTYNFNDNNNDNNDKNDILKNSEIKLKIITNNTDELHKSLCEYINIFYHLYDNNHDIKKNKYGSDITITYIYKNVNNKENKKLKIDNFDITDNNNNKNNKNYCTLSKKIIYYNKNNNKNNENYTDKNNDNNDENYTDFINNNTEIIKKFEYYVNHIYDNDNDIINSFIYKNQIYNFFSITDVIKKYITNHIKHNITFIGSNKNDTIYNEKYIFNNNDKYNEMKNMFNNIFDCDFRFKIDQSKKELFYYIKGMINKEYILDPHTENINLRKKTLQKIINQGNLKNYVYLEVYNEITQQYDLPSSSQSEIIELLYNIYTNPSNIIMIDEPFLYCTPQTIKKTIKKFFKCMTYLNKQIILYSNRKNIINIYTDI